MVILFGAAPDTGNEGVTALCHSALAGLSARGVGPVAVADHGRGVREDILRLGERSLCVRRIGLTHSRRFWRQDCLSRVALLARVAGLGNPAAMAVRSAGTAFDVSGGDSFTDLYGARRFEAMCLTKRLALDAGCRLVLLPQTLGPFRDPRNRRTAAGILRRADAVWVRDAASLEILKGCLGDDFDPDRHRAGVDMAVLLPRTRPRRALPEPIAGWIDRADGAPLAGLNVSGLLCNEAVAARSRFGLRADHRAALAETARALLGAEPGLRLVLVPHVNCPEGHPESDWAAARALEAALAADFPGCVATLPRGFGASELKWIISRLDWFAGARMHATIAAFSSGVPTLSLGYSDKAAGVFAACGIGSDTADLRVLDADALGAAALGSFARRGETRRTLSRLLPGLGERAERQMDLIAAAALPGADARPAAAA